MDHYLAVSTSSKSFLDRSIMYNLEDCGWCNKLRNWAIDTATVLFDDNHNDLRALPKTVRSVSYTHLTLPTINWV